MLDTALLQNVFSWKEKVCEVIIYNFKQDSLKCVFLHLFKSSISRLQIEPKSGLHTSLLQRFK